MTSVNNYILRLATLDDFPTLSTLENESYPEDEIASEESMKRRVNVANQYFLCYIHKETNEIVGFINGTCVLGNKISKDSMSSHDSHGRTLVLHSVVIISSQRRKGLATNMLKEYLTMIKSYNSVDLILLLSKASLLSFYISIGFQVKRLSPVSHGKESWFELAQEVQDIDSQEQVQIDAFCTGPFSGNPAAVVFKQKDEIWMQKLANENNLAETAFLEVIPGSENKFYSLRWFTPVTEVDLCGHATLAAAYALYETNRVSKSDEIQFYSKSGILFCKLQPDGLLSLNFPSTPPVDDVKLSIPIERNLLIEGLGILSSYDILFLGKTKFDVFIELTREAFVKIHHPKNFESIAKLGGRGLIVTTLGGKHSQSGDLHDQTNVSSRLLSILEDKRYDFVSRCYFPNCQINEDPVTGSAHCALTPYWVEKLNLSLGDTLVANQASPREGILLLKLLPDDRVELSGRCVITIKSKVIV